MVNILIPTDLSDLSKIAVQYAFKIANKLEGTVTLLHVVSIIQPTRASMRLQLKSLEDDLVATAKEDLEIFVKDVSKQLKTSEPLKVKVVKGTTFNDTVLREAKKLRTGLIVMGTRGASGLKKYVLGSNTASVIEVSHVPVLAVPELGEFKSFKNILYATDLRHTHRELKTLIPYLEKFGATVHLLHVTPSLKEVAALEKKIDAIVTKAGITNVTCKVIVNKNIEEAIDYYVAESKVDLLTMFTHDVNFYEKLFNRSVTRKMAFHSKIPLLAFRQK
ncbi:universal stress protein [Chryseolinea sp. H1M3-3]|uniref:universal stress protein n=1 Tax=Chryseolinea sp. H1M3-3 TaxID=3034144 RepID=UPI0023EE0024|nr:universal stress protein [Chryseolinea sp. H1M3-3]